MRHNKRMALLDDIQSALASKDGLQQALEHTIRALNAETGTIHLLEEDGVLHLKASHGIPDFVLNIVKLVPVGKGMAGLAVQRAEPISICNLQTDTSGDARPGAKQTGMEGAIVVPMIRAGKAVGALGVANRGERTFTEQEIETLLSVGRTLAL